ncbi:hypothetical protein [Paenibacillus sp. N3.4]|uniref:hypothetical protein n=1 Tax=Paenibacillus sp. N3.4 TaxID=2603222 RepID=UPI00164F98B3|nr:hypothetical protein [Paenibacillus sp. N3.4]
MAVVSHRDDLFITNTDYGCKVKIAAKQEVVRNGTRYRSSASGRTHLAVDRAASDPDSTDYNPIHECE